MRFDVSGPHLVPRYGSKKLITKESMHELIDRLDESSPGMTSACGCYVYAIRAGKGYTPWYVGQACKTTLVRESLNGENRGKYNSVESNGQPVMWYLPLLTPTGKYRKT